MATEEPKTLPVDQKTKDSEEAKDNMAIDKPAAPAVNGYACMALEQTTPTSPSPTPEKKNSCR